MNPSLPLMMMLQSLPLILILCARTYSTCILLYMWHWIFYSVSIRPCIALDLFIALKISTTIMVQILNCLPKSH